jgi:hypothetical protein
MDATILILANLSSLTVPTVVPHLEISSRLQEKYIECSFTIRSASFHRISIDDISEGVKNMMPSWRPNIFLPIYRWWKNKREMMCQNLEANLRNYYIRNPFTLQTDTKSYLLAGVVIVKYELVKLCIQKVIQVPESF